MNKFRELIYSMRIKADNVYILVRLHILLLNIGKEKETRCDNGCVNLLEYSNNVTMNAYTR